MTYRDQGAKALADAATELEAACPDHGDAEEAWMVCHCEAAGELRRKAELAEAARTTGLRKGWRSAATRIGVSDSEYVERCDRGEKWCTGCRAWHPRADFAADRGRGDGLQPSCRIYANRIRRDRHTAKKQAVLAPPASDRSLR
ncbi:hypothetical protein HHL19_16200 [Streptomyces sp. R302]|uniref:hypothetical protein n=1 Tax=unclassified Streptomyces TaxID=2593676 RepID=UPI00145F3BB9|nr:MULTISPECIES: hypothetical protein [unclassified Streptomyces]NML55315.1 hypothetical protein [Streptomyces sp. R301]NML80187.1 hypothetical protein [Streptomyces sp. R302]